MSDALPERLARAAREQAERMQYGLLDPGDVEGYVAYAIRSALDEAAKVAREHESVLDDGPFAKWTTTGGRFAQEIAAAIEALKG